MNVFHNVTLQSLKKNKTRTVVTIIGIILSAAMICAVTTFASSIQDYLLRGEIYTEGDWHASQLNASYDLFSRLNGTGELETVTAMQQLGYSIAEQSKNEYKPYFYVLGTDDATQELLPIHITGGRFPESGSEILLPDSVLTNGQAHYQIGDVITLNLGDRILDGQKVYQQTPNYYYDNGETILCDETIRVRETRSYTVVGLYERLPLSIEEYTAPGYTCFTQNDETVNDYALSIFFRLKKAGRIYDFVREQGLTGRVNTDVLMYSGVSRYRTFYQVLISVCAIVIGLIMFGSVSLIYNAFAISVSERTKQFGLLSSVGATKKQLREMVIFEALAVSAVGIPLGVLSGIAGIGITLYLIGEKFSVLGYPVDMRLSVSVPSVVAAVIISLITVLISAFIPSRRATKISAVEAIRQNTDIKAKEKEVRTSKLTYKLFGLPGVLASKHYKRSKKKYRTTIVSLFMSIVLFVSASAFGEYLIESVEGSFGRDTYDLRFTIRYEEGSTVPEPDQLLAVTASSKAVTDGVYLQTASVNASVNRKYLNERGIYTFSIPDDGDVGNLYTYAFFVNDGEFRRLATASGLQAEDYFQTDHPLAIAVDGTRIFDRNAEKYVQATLLSGDEAVLNCTAQKEIPGYRLYDTVEEDGKLVFRYIQEETGEYLDLPAEEACISYDLEAKGKITDSPYYITYHGMLVLLYPYSMRQFVMPERLFDYYEFYYLSSDHKASEAAINQTLLENGLGTKKVYNNAEDQEGSRNLVTIMQVFSYGFIVLISLIAAANVFNTMSTNISLRRREFAMLKTVGMTKKGFNRMMNFECVLYGSRSLLFGLPVSAFVTYLIYQSIDRGYETAFRLPWSAMGIATLSVFLVVFATMMYAMSKINRDNPIDALKNENL